MKKQTMPFLFRLLLRIAVILALVVPAFAAYSYTGRKVEYVNDGDTQEPWAAASRNNLISLLPSRTAITIQTDVEEKDVYGRVLGHVIRESDKLDTNREQLRMGHVVTYVIWPNVANFEDYRTAQIEAQNNGRGIWNPQSPLTELPFEYRVCTAGSSLKPVGDWFTKKFVDPADYKQVHVNNRIFFWSDADAQAAGFTKCAKDSTGKYDSSCFASGN